MFYLKQYDTTLLSFEIIDDNLEGQKCRIHSINRDNSDLFPIGLKETDDGLQSWLRSRIIPKNREYVDALLAKRGLSHNDLRGILQVCLGLSLNDSYWVVDDSFTGLFDQYNLYENRLSRILANIAFTGYGSSVRSSLASSPEFTTNGMLPKCWRRMSGKIFLYKGGTSGASNAGNEPYSEFYASQVAKAMKINAIPYGLAKWKGNLCSTCELFTSKNVSYIPIGRIVTKGGLEAVADYYRSLGPEFEKAFRDMLVFDAVICNTDRHYGNFGLLIDSNTNQPAAPAPLFDHGNSLFNYAGDEFFQTETTLDSYTRTLQPCVYDDFIGTAASYMDDENREELRHLLTFKFKKHNRYNLPDHELTLIQNQVRKRARLLLEYKK